MQPLRFQQARLIRPILNARRTLQQLVRKSPAPAEVPTTGASDELYYSDEDLLKFYRSLFTPDSEPTPLQQLDSPTPNEAISAPSNHIIEVLETRFGTVSSSQNVTVSPLLASLYSMRRHSQPSSGNLEAQESEPHARLLQRISTIVEDAERTHTVSTAHQGPSTGTIPVRTMPVPLGLVSYKEWFELARYCLHIGDIEAVHTSITLMIRSGMHPPEGLQHYILETLANKSLIPDFERTLTLFKHNSLAMDDALRHLHVKIYLKAHRLEEARQIIHSYEKDVSTLPSLKTYTALISALFRPSLFTSSSKAADPQDRAMAWDMFAHMRYVAHPTPDAHLYSVMIRACADAPIPQAERALDLWTEMNVDNRIKPTRQAYNAVILACARSSRITKDGEGDFSHDAFRLAQQMLEEYHESGGNAELRPDLETFCALLESCKRKGDLKKARWILGELVKASRQSNELAPNEEVMAHMFQVYASYRAPMRRDTIRRAEPPAPISSPLLQSSAEHARLSASSSVPIPEAPSDYTPSASHLPQTRAEVLTEASVLFSRILGDITSNPSPLSFFSSVKPTPNLINSYMSIVFTHGTLDQSRQAFDIAFEEMGVVKNARSYFLAMQRCAKLRDRVGREEAESALDWARQLWSEYRELEESRKATGKSTSARTTEKMWSAKIRILAIAGHLDEALATVKEFASLFPPSNIFSISTALATATPDANLSSNVPSRSLRTALGNISQPLVRLSTPIGIADTSIPPYFLFNDVEILHHRLLVKQRIKDIGYLKWLCSSYEGALVKRRQVSLPEGRLKLQEREKQKRRNKKLE